jgi:hypothetical protein
MGLVCQALHPEYCFSMIANVREEWEWEESTRTLMALSQAACSSVLKDLHSPRTCGAEQSHKATADQRTTRVTERIEGASIAGLLGMRRGTKLATKLAS